MSSKMLRAVFGAGARLVPVSGVRETKAALLLFIRTGETTTIIEKAIAEIKKHPNFKRARGTVVAGERYDFVLHANGDPNQKIRLAFLPFALQDARAPR
jgi:hypothetical protein